MTRRTPEANFLYTQTPDRPPLAAVTRSNSNSKSDRNSESNRNLDNDNNKHNNNNAIFLSQW